VASVLSTLADAVVTELNAQSWDETFTAVRRDAPHFDATPTTLQVVVVPRARGKQIIGRGHNQLDYTVDIGLRQQLAQLDVGAADANTDLDALVALVEAIDDHFDTNTLPGYATARWVGSEWVNEAELVRSAHLFAATITVTWRVLAAR